MRGKGGGKGGEISRFPHPRIAIVNRLLFAHQTTVVQRGILELGGVGGGGGLAFDPPKYCL